MLEEFFERLSSSEPVPGGGSVAALETAAGAALLVMVANLTLGKRKYAEVQERVAELRRRALQLMELAQALIEEDAAAYRRVADALALPRDGDAEKKYRTERVQEALKGAVDPPWQTMKVAREVVDLGAELVVIGNRSAVSDVGTAALSAGAGYHAASLNVEINLQAILDQEWVAATQAKLVHTSSPDSLVATILERTHAMIRGESE